ncbi:MAG: GIY-YIG nuclease family protein, partial [Ignavibacteria bacterium]|nr:GIY-YIG nuclease family protein [Ignavibacteria bacterium]
RDVGSSPTRGAIPPSASSRAFFMYFLYILRSESSDRYYVGVSGNPERRLTFHNTVERGFTSRYRAWKIVSVRGFGTKKEAIAAEQMVKRWKSRRMIERLIDGEIQW